MSMISIDNNMDPSDYSTLSVSQPQMSLPPEKLVRFLNVVDIRLSLLHGQS